jgi:hypothetical protein
MTNDDNRTAILSSTQERVTELEAQALEKVVGGAPAALWKVSEMMNPIRKAIGRPVVEGARYGTEYNAATESLAKIGKKRL